MHATGHIGLGFLCVAPIYVVMRIAGIDLSTAIVVTCLGAVLAWLPDLDMYFGVKHRGPTHTIVLGAIVAFGISLVFSYSPWDAFFAFVCVFLTFSLHIFGDLFTVVQMQIFAPFSKKKYGGWKKFKSASKKANEYFFYGGITAYVLVLALLSF